MQPEVEPPIKETRSDADLIAGELYGMKRQRRELSRRIEQLRQILRHKWRPGSRRSAADFEEVEKELAECIEDRQILIRDIHRLEREMKAAHSRANMAP